MRVAIVAILVAFALAAAGCTGAPTNSGGSLVAPPGAVARSPRSAPSRAVAATASATSKARHRIRFGPAAASFVTTDDGWVLGHVGCGSCAGIRSTVDGGQTWTVLPGLSVGLSTYEHPPNVRTAVDDIYFANHRDGYIFGPGLEMSVDGGRTWSVQRLPRVVQLVGTAARVYALTDPSRSLAGDEALWSSRVGSTT